MRKYNPRDPWIIGLILMIIAFVMVMFGIWDFPIGSTRQWVSSGILTFIVGIIIYGLCTFE